MWTLIKDLNRTYRWYRNHKEIPPTVIRLTDIPDMPMYVLQHEPTFNMLSLGDDYRRPIGIVASVHRLLCRSFADHPLVSECRTVISSKLATSIHPVTLSFLIVTLIHQHRNDYRTLYDQDTIIRCGNTNNIKEWFRQEADTILTDLSVTEIKVPVQYINLIK